MRVFFQSTFYLLLGCLAAGPAFSQGFIGISSQSDAGLWSVYQNPAFLASDAYAFRLHLASGGLHFDNNYIKYNAPFSMVDLLRGRNERPLDAYDLEEIRDGKPKNGTLVAEVRGPALALKLGPSTHVALMSRVRSGVQVSNASEKLLGVVRLGLSSLDYYQDLEYLALYATNSDNQFTSVSQAYAEWALALGQVLSRSDQHQLRAGLTVKRYFGYAAGFVRNRSLKYRLLPDPSASNAALLQIDSFDADLGYTQVSDGSAISLSSLFGNNATGRGWGLDLGVSYDLLSEQPDRHTLRLSASLTDVGRISYRDPRVRKYTINAENVQTTEEEWRNFSNPEEGESVLSGFGRILEEQYGLTETDRTNQFSLAASQALNLSADLRLLGKLFVNTTVIQSVRLTQVPGLRASSLVAVTPRLDMNQLGLAFPVIRQNGAWSVGGSARLGPLVVGSDNLLGLFARQGRLTAQGVDIYAGLSFGIRSRRD
jgi:hypothetical protein